MEESTQKTCSRSPSPDASTIEQTSAPVSDLPVPIDQFFKAVSPEGFPAAKKAKAKVQPWKQVWDGPQPPADDGKLIVACPKIATYGSNNLGGL